MKNKGGIILLILLGSFAIIQFWQVDKNQDPAAGPNDFIVQNPTLEESLAIKIQASCYDCHSNNTNYPWYAHVAPFSWMINQHITNGKAALNFSDFASLEKKQKISVLGSICEVITDSTMPPPNYIMLHRDAAFDAKTITSICDWADEAALGIIRNR